MRTIKFKAKRVDNGEWVYGSLVDRRSIRFIIEQRETETGFAYDRHEVIPETVCQFTGLTDKNGVEIWEGDLFQVARNQIYTVKFSGGHEHNYEWFGGCFAMFLDDEVGFPFDEYAMQNGMVIGNIHDK